MRGPGNQALHFKMESLFSLEMHVESVEDFQVICRLPAVSFRLLDFPTLIIHHVSPIMAEKLRHKVVMESSSGEHESSLKELKDRHGNFQFQKGKSCLFKANIDVLQTQLQTTPLYVMLLDLWPKKPKLVGSGGVEIKTAIDAIHKQVKAKGVAVPSFYKEFGDFDLFNLMGSAVARVKLGYRLVSLGGSLIPHVPATTVSRREENRQLTEAIKEDIHEESDTDIREAASAEMDSKKVKQVAEHQHTQTQTTFVGAPKANPRLSEQDREEEQDLIITNTVCPPPLYFNALSEPQRKSITELNTEDPENPINNTNTGYTEDLVDFLCDASALLDEKVHCTSVSVQTDLTVIAGQAVTTGPQNEAVTHQPPNGLQSLFTVMESATSSKYPVLHALFQELSCVTTQQHRDESGRPSTEPGKETGLSKRREKTQRSVTKPTQSSQNKSSTKKTAVSKNSSVIGFPRQRVRFRPTGLTYKTTRTQQMRLEQIRRGRVDRVRLCAAVSQQQEQSHTAKETPKQTPGRDLGRTYNKEQDPVETTVASAEKERVGSARENTVTTSWPGATQKSAQSQMTSQCNTSPAASYQRQSSLEIFLPTVDGETDSSCAEEAPHPPLDSTFGHTGILNLDAVPSGTELPSTARVHCDEDFDDTTSWRDNKTVDSAHSSLKSSISDNASQHSNDTETSGNFRPPISKSPQKISRSRRPKSADSLVQKVSLSDAYPRETRSSSDLFNSEEISRQANKQSLLSNDSTVKEKEGTKDDSYSDDFLSGSEAEQSESQESDSHID